MSKTHRVRPVHSKARLLHVRTPLRFRRRFVSRLVAARLTRGEIIPKDPHGERDEPALVTITWEEFWTRRRFPRDEDRKITRKATVPSFVIGETALMLGLR